MRSTGSLFRPPSAGRPAPGPNARVRDPIRAPFSRPEHRPTAMVLATLLAACSAAGDEDGRSSVSVRDSAGITLVENGPIPSDAAEWQLLGPTIEIGTLDGASEYQLFQTRGAVRLPDGRLVLANGGTHELRWYAADGGYLRSVGSEGEGPGEFKAISSLRRFGDSLFVYDRRQRRATIFDTAGNFVRSYPLEEAGFPGPTGVFADGSSVTVGAAARSAGTEVGLVRPDVAVRLFGPDGSQLLEVGTFPGQETFLGRSGDMMMVSRFLGARGFKATTAGDRIILGDMDRYEFRAYDRTGRIRSIVRLDRPQVTMTGDDYEQVKAERLEDIPEEMRERFAESTEGRPEPETLTSFSDILGNVSGSVWVRDTLHPLAEHQQWTVFGPDGRALTKVRFDNAFRPYEVGDNYVLGVFRDELEVERLQLWALQKPTPIESVGIPGS